MHGFTRFDKNSASVPDVWVGTENILKLMQKGQLHDLTAYSDHVPMSFQFEMQGACKGPEECDDRYPVMSRSSVELVASDAAKLDEVKQCLRDDPGFKTVSCLLREVSANRSVLGKPEVSRLVSFFLQCSGGCHQ